MFTQSLGALAYFTGFVMLTKDKQADERRGRLGCWPFPRPRGWCHPEGRRGFPEHRAGLDPRKLGTPHRRGRLLGASEHLWDSRGHQPHTWAGRNLFCRRLPWLFRVPVSDTGFAFCQIIFRSAFLQLGPLQMLWIRTPRLMGAVAQPIRRVEGWGRYGKYAPKREINDMRELQ